MDGLQDSLKVVDTGADPAADVMVGVMLAMLDYEQFAATMRTIAQVMVDLELPRFIDWLCGEGGRAVVWNGELCTRHGQ